MQKQSGPIARDLDGLMEPAEVERVLARLDAYTIPSPGPDETESLIAALRPLMDRQLQPERPARFRDWALAQPGLRLWQAMLPQVRLIHPGWWLASLLAVFGGVALAGPMTQQGIPLSALAPLLVIAGVVYTFRTLRGGALELELSCPITPAQAVLSRMVMMLAYDLVLGCAAALLSGGPAWPLLLAWCAALSLFAGLMLTLTLFTGTVPAAGIALAIWGALLVLSQTRTSLFPPAGTHAWLITQMTALAVGGVLLAYGLSRRALSRMIGRGGY